MSMLHAIKHCHSWWLRRRGVMPAWRDDPVAKLLGIAEYGCSLCGHGATAERASEEAS